jgi:hypothetical protein
VIISVTEKVAALNKRFLYPYSVLEMHIEVENLPYVSPVGFLYWAVLCIPVDQFHSQ